MSVEHIRRNYCDETREITPYFNVYSLLHTEEERRHCEVIEIPVI